MDETPEIKIDTTMTSAKKSLASTGSLIAKKTERTKLATVTIPRAYAELGKSVYKDAGKRIAFTSQFEQLDKLLAERKKIHEDAKARPSASTFADKAKQVAAEATDLAKTKAIDLKVYQAFARLGESVYTKLGADAGPEDVVGPLATAITRRDTLDTETAGIEESAKGQWITPRRIVIGGIALLGFVVLAMISPDGPPTEGGGNDKKPSDSDTSVVDKANKATDNDETGNTISATDLMTLRNAAAIRKRFRGRFVVTGRVIDIDEEGSGFGRRNYKVRLVGTLNSAGLADTWVECHMKKDGGLDKVGPGHYVEVEGEYDRTLGAVVEMKNCWLSKKLHDY